MNREQLSARPGVAPAARGGLEDIDEQVIGFLREHPRSPSLRIVQQVMPELFRMRPPERTVTYAWVTTRLDRLAQKGVLLQETAEWNTVVWSAQERHGGAEAPGGLSAS